MRQPRRSRQAERSFTIAALFARFALR